MSSRRKPRIWVVTPQIHRSGGTERSVWEHVARWRHRYDLRVYTSTPGDMVDIEGIDVRAVPAVPGPHLLRWAAWFTANTVRRWIDGSFGQTPDALVSPGVNCADADAVGVHLLFDRLSRGGGTPSSSPARRLHRDLYFRLLRIAERRVYSGPATVWAVSERDARAVEDLAGRPQGTVDVVPHGVDAEVFNPSGRADRRDEARETLNGRDRRVVLLVGNDPAVKGVDIAIEALASLPVDVTLALAGTVDRGLVENWAARSGVRDRIAYWPHTEDMLSRYAAADVLIAPSRHDSFNLPVLEAMACGLPVVVSAAAGVSEHIHDRADAVVIPDPVDPLALAEAIGSVLDEPAGAEALAAGGLDVARALTWDRSAERAVAVLDRELSTPRVLVLATDAARTGGIQRATRTLISALSERFGPERVGSASVWAGDQAVDGRVLGGGDVRRGDVDVGLWRSVRYSASVLFTARRWRRRLVVVATHPHLAPVAWAIRSLTRAPYVVWCHGTEVWGPLDAATAASIRRADRVVAPSRFTADQVARWASMPRTRVTVIPHCVPPGLTPSAIEVEAGSRPPVVLTVARLHPDHAYKGIDRLIDAWPKVGVEHPEARLVVVGEGPDCARLIRRAADAGVGERVEFPGRLSDDELREAYADARVYAMPARHRVGPEAEGEGFGLVFVEAGAAGVPVVAGWGAGADDAVVEAETGLMVDPEDVSEIAAAIVRLLSDDALATALGRGGRELATTRFSYERFRDAFADLVEGAPIRGLFR